MQANILNLLTRLRRDKQLAMLMISHDLRVIGFTSDRVAVLYLGQVVEIADRDDLFDPASCRYNTRWPFATDICRTITPELREVGSGHQARCRPGGRRSPS